MDKVKKQKQGCTALPDLGDKADQVFAAENPADLLYSIPLDVIADWKKMAADGFPAAQFNLGVCYYNGEGVPQNYSEAMKWYRLAMETGVPGAQYETGEADSNGD